MSARHCGWHGRSNASRKNRLGELNTDLRSFPPSHAAIADGCAVKHKIECIGNSDGTFHLEAGTQVRQVEDRTIDRRPAALKGDACSLESTAAARFISALLLRVIHLFDLPATCAQVRFPWPSSLGRQPCAKLAAKAACKSYEIAAPEIGGAAGHQDRD